MLQGLGCQGSAWMQGTGVQCERCFSHSRQASQPPPSPKSKAPQKLLVFPSSPPATILTHSS